MGLVSISRAYAGTDNFPPLTTFRMEADLESGEQGERGERGKCHAHMIKTSRSAALKPTKAILRMGIPW